MQILSGTFHLTCACITCRQMLQTAQTWKNYMLPSSFFRFTLFICVGRGKHTYVMACTWNSKDNSQETVLHFHTMSSRNQTQDFRLGGKDLNPLNPLPAPVSRASLNPHKQYTNTQIKVKSTQNHKLPTQLVH